MGDAQMQGLTSMDDEKDVLDDRKRRRLALAAEMKTLGKHKKRIKFRLVEGRSWPIDSATGENADVEREDVMAQLPDDMKAPIGDIDEKMQLLRAEADKHQAFADDIVPIDEGVLLRRRAERQAEDAARESVRGEKWTPELVEARLEEGFRTLFRTSLGGSGPRAFGNAMPEIIKEVSDLVHQAGNKSLRNAIAHRFKGVPTTEEVRRADEALTWASRYLLGEHPDLAAFVNLQSMWRAWNSNISKKCQSIGVNRQTFYRDAKKAVKIIVDGLTREGRAPL
jgi:hypothetical protein